MLEEIKRYYRQKRIHRLLTLYNKQQPEQNVMSREYGRQAPLISRDTLISLVLTFICLVLVGQSIGLLTKPLTTYLLKSSSKIAHAFGLIPGLASAFLAVELSDWLIMKLQHAIDRTFDFIIPAVLGVLLIVTLFVLSRKNLVTEVGESLMAFRADVNERMQKKPLDIKLSQSRGVNWILSTVEIGNKTLLKPLTKLEADTFCQLQGKKWVLFDGDPRFVPTPQMTASRGFYVWYLGHAAYIEPSGIAPPKSFRSAGSDELIVTLCIEKDPVQ